MPEEAPLGGPKNSRNSSYPYENFANILVTQNDRDTHVL